MPNHQTTRPGIDIDPGRRGGRPVLNGTGFTVAQLVAEIADGRSPAEVADNFDLDPGVVSAALTTLSLWLDRPGAMTDLRAAEASPATGWTEPVYANNKFGVWGVVYVHAADARAAAEADEHQERSLCFWLGRDGGTDDVEWACRPSDRDPGATHAFGADEDGV